MEQKYLLSEKKEQMIRQYEDLRKVEDIEFISPEIPMVDEFLTERLLEIFTKMQPQPIGKSTDWWMVVVGREGLGKSTFTTGMLHEYCKLVNLDFQQSVKRGVAYDEEDLLFVIRNVLTNLKPYQFIWCDEGANVWFNRESMSKLRKLSIKFSNAMRFLGFFVVICAVEFAQLDTVIRDHRVKSIVRIEKNGVYHYYNEEQTIRLALANSGQRTHGFSWAKVEPEHVGRFYWDENIEKLIRKIKLNYTKRFLLDINNIIYEKVKQKMESVR